MQKARRHTFVLRPLVGARFQVLFHSSVRSAFHLSLTVLVHYRYILTKLVIDRNAGNMSFLKVMGYDDKEIKRLYLNATTIVVLVSLIVSAPLSYFTMDKLMKFAFMRFAGYIEIYMPYYLYALVLVLGLLVYSIVSFIINKTIQRIDLGEALKDTE